MLPNNRLEQRRSSGLGFSKETRFRREHIIIMVLGENVKEIHPI
jgi:hypothetical protein